MGNAKASDVIKLIELTKQNVKEMKKLRKLGWMYKDIAKKLKINQTTVGLYCRNEKGICHKRDGIGDHPEEIPLFIRQNLAKQKEEEKPKEYGEKEEKWRMTHFRNFNCFKVYGTQ